MKYAALAVGGVALALVAGTAGVAGASPVEEKITNPAQVGHREVWFYDNTTGSQPAEEGFARWSSYGVDSPLDRGDKALRVQLPAGTPDGNYYSLFYTDRSTDRDIAASKVHNLSFDRKAASAVGGGAPRISVEFLNGDIAYLSAEYCSRTLTLDPRWTRSDFTRAKSDCGFYVTGDTGGYYAADGTNTAWQNYVAANPNQRVTSDYVVMDVGDATYWLDHIALGTKFAYTSGDNKGVRCFDREGRC